MNDHRPVIEVTLTSSVSVPENSASAYAFGLVVSDADSDVALSTFDLTLRNADNLGDPIAGAYDITPSTGIGSGQEVRTRF